MAVLSDLLRFGSRRSRKFSPPHNDDDDHDGSFDGSPDDHLKEALLKREDDDTESPPPYRTKQRRTIISAGLAAALAAATLLFGLLALCFLWHMTMHKAAVDPLKVQEMRLPSEMTTVTSDIEEDLPDIEGSTMDPEIFAGWKDCGSNIKEAHEKGCLFDVMLHSWVPEDCFDKELMDRYLTEVPYRWYRDERFEEEITIEEMRRGEHGSAAVKLEEHGTHCAYVLEKNLRAIMKGKSVARSIFSVQHAVHCIGLIVDPSSNLASYTKVVVEYDQCGIPHFGSD